MHFRNKLQQENQTQKHKCAIILLQGSSLHQYRIIRTVCLPKCNALQCLKRLIDRMRCLNATFYARFSERRRGQVVETRTVLPTSALLQCNGDVPDSLIARFWVWSSDVCSLGPRLLGLRGIPSRLYPSESVAVAPPPPLPCSLATDRRVA